MKSLTLTSFRTGNELAPALERACTALTAGLNEAGWPLTDARVRATTFMCAQASLLVQATADLWPAAACAVIQTDDDQDVWLFVRAHGGIAGLSLGRHAEAVGLSLGTPSQAFLDWNDQPGVNRMDAAVRALRLCPSSQGAARTAVRSLLAAAQTDALLKISA